jgi:site-specific recombinase XerD
MPDWQVEIVNYRRYLKRRNCAPNTLRCYLNDLAHFRGFVNKPLGQVMQQDIEQFIEQQQGVGMSAGTINRRLLVVRQLYCYLRQSDQPELIIPVQPKLHRLKQADPLPRSLKSEEVECLFAQITDIRDRTICTLMLRCGLRVAEVAALTLDDLDLTRQQLLIREPKNRRDRIVYLAPDACLVLNSYREPSVSRLDASNRMSN